MKNFILPGIIVVLTIFVAVVAYQVQKTPNVDPAGNSQSRGFVGDFLNTLQTQSDISQDSLNQENIFEDRQFSPPTQEQTPVQDSGVLALEFIVPQRAATFEVVILRGSGFGSDVGSVDFISPGASSGVGAQIESWNNSEIAVTVPFTLEPGQYVVGVRTSAGENSNTVFVEVVASQQ